MGRVDLAQGVQGAAEAEESFCLVGEVADLAEQAQAPLAALDRIVGPPCDSVILTKIRKCVALTVRVAQLQEDR